MTFGFPQALWLLALVPLIAFFHFFEIERVTRRVTTLRFWPVSTRERGAHRAAVRRFHPSILFYLELIALSALVVALANPLLHSTVSGPEYHVIVIDDSASMAATDVAPSRFEVAKRRALDLIRSLVPGQQAVLMSLGAGVVVSTTTDLERVTNAIATLDIAGGVGNEQSLQHAQAIGATLGNSAIHVFSDRRVSLTQTSTTPAVQWHLVGSQAPNIGITELNARPVADRPGELEVFLRIRNFGPAKTDVPLTVTFNGDIVSEASLDLAQDVARAIVIPFDAKASGVVSARIELEDALVSDNSAQLSIAAAKQTRVAIVTPGNLFLEQALAADARTTIKVVQAAAISHTKLVELGQAYDVVVVDNVSIDNPADTPLAGGRFLFVRTLPSNAPLVATGVESIPVPVDWKTDHPVTQYVDFSDVLIKEATIVQPTGAGITLVESARTPLLYAWQTPQLRAIFVGFDVFASDLRVRVGFPILLRNAVDWLSIRGEATAREIPPRGTANPMDERESNLTVSASTGPDIVAEPTSFVHPTPIWLWLALAALIAFLINVVLFVYRIPADRRTFGRIALTSAPAVIALSLIVAALALPHTERPSNKLHLAVVEDRSASVVHRGSLVDLPALKSMQRPGDSLSHLRFSGGTHAARTDDSSTALATDSSNIESALQVALGTTPGGQSRRIVLISDGLQTTGDAVRAARRAGTAQVPIDTIAINATLNGEVVVEQLHVPDEVREGETYDVRIIAHANSAVTAQLVLTRNEQVIADETVELKAGKNVFVYEHFADTQGYHVFAAALQAPGDTHPQNNEALAVVAVHQPARILLFESEPNASAHFVAALGAQGINVDTLGKEDVETGLRNLYQYDALILSNFSSLNLTRAQMERIRGYVYDLGGGLAMFGGEQSFGLGGYYKTPVEEALPVTMVAKQRLDVPSTSVVLVIDRSGSMNRFDGEFNRLDLAKEAAQRAASLLGERSELGVLAFDMKSKWVVPIGAMEDRPGILKSIATLRAGGGGTQLLWGLEKAYRAIARRKTAIRHVIILSDGEVYSTRFPELLRNMVRKNITVSAVTIASQVGISQLRDISQLGKGRFYFTGDASKLPRIFTMETQLATKTGLIEESFTPTVNNRRHEIMRGFDWDNVPSLDGYVATTAKGSAETLLSSHRDDPLVAVWRYGLGRAAVFTSEYKTRWGADWLRWKDFSPAGATLVRWLLRSDPRRDVAAKATFVDDSGKVLVDVAGRDGQRLNFLHGELAVVRPNQTREVIPMVQNAAGLYRAQFAARDNGAYLLGVSLKQNEKSLPSTTTQLVRSYSREYRRFGVDQAILNSIADASGGVRRSSLEGVYDSARPTGAEQHSIWPRWLSVALLALLATIATRWLADRYRLWEHHNA